ncbi:hypothetical protein [Fredinandcohnia quinoae]|uniref:Uncharacterized protein n=1 Tax=Fredinandcohnia quinoae TaxID=2918902 RepID=A0AAW5ECG8_9BACI|nr:hypothetical protein [Fredinandcohnia sp. SECRCQ15]MCH1627385.1 hypothetical protein [Fredinandcohnia sp. SECRCQ15]
MKQEKERLKNQLNQELGSLQFTKQQKVIDRIHPITWKQKMASILNKEIELPLLPLSLAILLLLLPLGIKGFLPQNSSQSDKVLVEINGNIYWKDELDRAVKRYEN